MFAAVSIGDYLGFGMESITPPDLISFPKDELGLRSILCDYVGLVTGGRRPPLVCPSR